MRRPCISAHPTSVPRKRQRLQMRSSPASATRPFRHKRAVSRASAPAMGIRVTEKRTGAPRRERDRSGKLMSIGPAIPWEESRPCPSRRSVALGLTKRVSAAGANLARRVLSSRRDKSARQLQTPVRTRAPATHRTSTPRTSSCSRRRVHRHSQVRVGLPSDWYPRVPRRAVRHTTPASGPVPQ